MLFRVDHPDDGSAVDCQHLDVDEVVRLVAQKAVELLDRESCLGLEETDPYVVDQDVDAVQRLKDLLYALLGVTLISMKRAAVGAPSWLSMSQKTT